MNLVPYTNKTSRLLNRINVVGPAIRTKINKSPNSPILILLSLFMPLVMPKYALVVIMNKQIKRITNSRANEEDIPRNVATISAISGNERPSQTPAPARIPNIKKISSIVLKK